MTFSKPKRKNNDDSLPVWAWIFIGMVVMAAAAIVIYFGMLVIAFDGFMEETYFRLSDDSARSYAYHELKIDIPSDAIGIFLEYNVDYSSPVTLRFDVPVSLGTAWVDEVICPQDRFPNAEVSMRNPLEAISSVPPDEQPIEWIVSCSANPNMQIYMQQDEPETWHITITARPL
ncbi:MAG: hypothetical protein KC615_16710 [Anaerolineae bacterium]|nr:hypothetical protein [Anaerolineae bacterium]